MISIHGLHHIALICSDYQSSKRFYMDLFGFEILAEVYRKERDSYKLDLIHPSGIRLELFSFTNPPKRISNPEAAGLRHLAFKVKDVEETILNLKKIQIQVENSRIDAATGKKFTFLSDPDGLPIELYEV